MHLKIAALILSAAALLPGANQSDQKKEGPGGDHCSPPVAGAPSLPAKLMDGMGTQYLDFKITTSNPEAQKFFNQGIAQMHSFWSREAERSFRMAASLDPSAPMPWWGVAMVSVGDFRPQFQIDGLNLVAARQPVTNPRAKQAVEKALALSAVPGKATDLEKMYIAAVAARRNPGSRNAHADYVQALRDLIKKYPDQVEAKLYLSLQIMSGFVLPDKTPRVGSMEAVTILRELVKSHPDHPGVLHFIIHGWEGSTFAEEAEFYSHRYAQLAPAIPHALHMPGHIFSQTGKWSLAAKYFEMAKTQEIAYMTADPTYGSGHHGHNTHYLATVYSFGGEYDKAIHTAKRLLEYTDTPAQADQLDNFYSAYRQAQFALIRTLVQHEKWDEILDGRTIPVIAKPRPAAWLAWARALAHTAKGQLAEARVEQAKLEKQVAELTKLTFDREAYELRVAETELRGHLLIADGRIDDGFRTLQGASDRDQRSRYSEPPWYPRPVAEAMGWQALRHQKYDLAKRSFETALKQFQQDSRALAGLAELEKLRGAAPSTSAARR
ncbi:MAG: hypothetical protein K2Q23_13065 [Bryobacteraceae bacterium]|nr:hypothetical protein [Bryobacteraceae bacterium]